MSGRSTSGVEQEARVMVPIAPPDGWVLAADVQEWAACGCATDSHGTADRDPWRDTHARAQSDAAYVPGGHVLTRTRVTLTGPISAVGPEHVVGTTHVGPFYEPETSASATVDRAALLAGLIPADVRTYLRDLLWIDSADADDERTAVRAAALALLS